MARPLRRVLIGMSIRLQISIREIESWDIPTIREYMAMLMEQAPGAKKPKRPRKQSSEEIAANFGALLGRPPKG